MSDLADRFRAVLDARRWSAREWGRRAGLGSPAHVSVVMLRDGRGRGPSAETLAALAAAAQVPLEWLATGNGPSGLDGTAHAERAPLPEPTLEREEPPAYSEDRTPVLRNAINWPSIERDAKAMAPEVPAWVWAALREAPPWSPAPLTAGAVAELARWWWRYVPEGSTPR